MAKRSAQGEAVTGLRRRGQSLVSGLPRPGASPRLRGNHAGPGSAGMASADVEGEQGRGSPWEPGSQEGGCRAGAPVRPPTRLVWRASAPRTCAIDHGRPCAPPGSAERGVLTRDAKRGTGHVSLGRTLSTVPGPRGHHALRKQNRAREEAGVLRGRGRRGAGAGAPSVSGGPWLVGTALARA